MGWILPAIMGASTAGNLLASYGAARAQGQAARRGQQFFEPYAEAGQQGLAALQQYAADPSSVRALPGYQFGLDEGMNQLQQRRAAAGQLGSGAMDKDLMRYAIGYADQQHQNALRPYMALASYGAPAAGQLAGLQGQQGEAQASNYVNMANTLRGAGQDLMTYHLLNPRIRQSGHRGRRSNPYGVDPYRRGY